MADPNAGSLSSLYHIEQLKEDNWFSWKMKIKMILDDRGLDGYIDGTKVKPAVNSPLQAEKDKPFYVQERKQLPPYGTN
ncbi:hypothetical protein K503DRAFT_805405 [Rhizopogon vinicolor AM-OR11-026]|uniref:Retrotransposon Copia-like N-terminal domain-containing protein n=1 Tax=Rhizopogon vinicolor AM-OR11-026 TaxID=1314800 RepID=A0A1B7MHY1_9AGAM|nr:hypothetical protein K503DRAFT_805405 [Rhizopogon vinicolor AM-OR11-026]